MARRETMEVHSQKGELLRWIGLWGLMATEMEHDERRVYWRGTQNFGQWMPERRFENILRAFALPVYKETDSE
jgi:hypothetical protein